MKLCAIAHVAALLGAVAPPAASAKEGVRATLADPAALAHARPGARVPITFELADAGGHPFGGGGIYLRLRGARGTVLDIPTQDAGRGRYVAMVTVPAGGVAAVTVGLPGWRFATGQRPVRADMVFGVTNFAAAPRRPPDATAPSWALLAAGAGAGVVALVAVRRRRRTVT